jgi:hypothetical protein
MKTAPVTNPRQLTPAFDYAMKFCGYGWVGSIDENGKQSKSLAPGVVWHNVGVPLRNEFGFHDAVPLYQVHELPVLDELKS